MRPPHNITIESDPPDLGVDMTDFFRSTSISFVVADPKLPDTPIVYVNRAFELTTGYSHRFVVGRNCRFLQGPDTDPEAVRNIAVALSRGEGVRQKILNYRADGSSFINDLVITPITDADGEISYFVGVQREVDEALDETEDDFRNKTISIVRQQVQIHLSVVMEMSRLHAEESEGQKPVDFISLLRRLEILDLLYENLNENSLRNEALDVGAYLSQITAKLISKTPTPGVRVSISMESVTVPLDIAVRLGVILAELLDTSLNISFKGLDAGHLEISLNNLEEKLELTVFDDGLGEPNAAEWLASSDIKAKVIRRLVSDLKAEISAPDTEHGREITLTMPLGGDWD